jgi:hypothetical protein
MAYMLWIALGCVVVGLISLGKEVRANYLRRERAEEKLEKLDSAIE